MRVITQHVFGGPDVLRIEDVADARAMPTEVLVRVHAVGLDPLETRVRQRQFQPLGQPPCVLDWDVSGVVEQSHSWRFAALDDVFGMPLFPRPAGAHSVVVAAPARQLARTPSSA